MKRNWKGGLFRIVLVSFFAAMVGYEVFTREGLLSNQFSWDNGIIFSLKIILIPAAIIYIIWWAINWCIIGFREPKLNINWEEGGNRLAIFLVILLVISFFIWIWASTKDLAHAFFSTGILFVPLLIIAGALYWISEGFGKSKNDKQHDKYNE